MYTFAKETHTIQLPSGEEADLRVFNAHGENLIIGFSCDGGKSRNQEFIATELSNDGVEVWMPDMLGAYMINKSKTNLKNIPKQDLEHLLHLGQQSHKKVYLLASGIESMLALKASIEAEKYSNIAGIILLFPRLNASKIEVGSSPIYFDSVGKTSIPIIIEGGNTPNRWGLNHLKTALQKNGSTVISKIIPGIRGYFLNREDPNRSEAVVTSQLSGIVKIAMFYINKEVQSTVENI